MATSSPQHSDSASLWRPLRIPTFRNLLFADVVSDIGTFMQSVGAAWMMVSLGAGPLYVALTQTASSLPFFILALPAGSVGDIVDRRRLVLFTEAWMIVVAIVLAAATLAGVMTPWLLLLLTFALSAGDAFETPTWRAILPEVVHKDDLASASALNGIEFNFARAVGPALAGVIVAAAGVGAAFVVNAVSFIGVIVVVARWKRPVHTRTTPPETVAGATVAAIRFVRFSPGMRGVMFRSGVVMFFASALLALLPSVARQVSEAATGYGVLLGCFGVGAVVGALAMQPARERWSTETVASGGVAIVGAATMVTGFVHSLPGLSLLMLVAGGAWIVFISLANSLIQRLAPDWVRARVLAVFLLLFQGGLAAGSVVWGMVAVRFGIETALLWAGLGTIATTALGLVAALPDTSPDVSPWIHLKMPTFVSAGEPGPGEGPVLVVIEYDVEAGKETGFIEAMHRYGRVRRRDGASRWGVFRDLERANRFVETFVVGSWAEHLRQHERSTLDDQELERRLRVYVRGTPSVRHLVYATPRPHHPHRS
jgi:MFS family permease